MIIAALPRSPSSRTPVSLSELKDFGSNPGCLRAKFHVPDGLGAGTPLVVALHGSQQSADDYANGAGWSHFADQHGFALLLPEQRRSNNPLLSFNWFGERDNRRSHGEALSIREMIATLVDLHGLDANNVFITGLSAGGAMAVVMMATYPEVFSGGAVIAGLPYGCANGAFQAIDRMHGLGGRTEASMEAMIRGASAYDGPWPTLSLWHGSADQTVSVDNVEAILGQWRALHGLSFEPTTNDLVDGYPRRVWNGSDGRELVEAFSITGMGHGTPIETIGEDGAGVRGAFMLDAHISSTRHIARFWGLAPFTPLPKSLAAEGLQAADGSGDGHFEKQAPEQRPQPTSGYRRDARSAVVHDLTRRRAATGAPVSPRCGIPLHGGIQFQMDLAAWMMVASVRWWWAAPKIASLVLAQKPKQGVAMASVQ